MSGPTHRHIEANGIRIHLAEQGSGPLVLLCHGFPESWYSWRHQLQGLAQAGFRAVAPDMRGYGDTDRPLQIERYSLLHLVGDMVGVLDALGEESAVIAGHDWGAPVAWHAALLRPDRFRAVVGLSVPYRPRGAVPPTTVMPQTDEASFYQLYFQAPGIAEAELEADVRNSLRRILFSASGDAPRRNPGAPQAASGSGGGITSASAGAGASGGGSGSSAIGGGSGISGSSAGGGGGVGMVPRSGGFLTRMPDPQSLPKWLTEADLEFYVRQFQQSGFRGGLNWYRNIDRNWELLAPFAGAKIQVPALYMAGDLDLVVAFPRMKEIIADLPRFIPQLRANIMLPGCGHWTQQERADEVNQAMIEFLRSL